MTDRQRNLFRLPKPVEFRLTPHQREVLDWVAYNEDRFALFPGKLSRTSLRLLIERELVVCIGRSPGRYALTEMGRAVRWRHAARALPARPAGVPLVPAGK